MLVLHSIEFSDIFHQDAEIGRWVDCAVDRTISGKKIKTTKKVDIDKPSAGKERKIRVYPSSAQKVSLNIIFLAH